MGRIWVRIAALVVGGIVAVSAAMEGTGHGERPALHTKDSSSKAAQSPPPEPEKPAPRPELLVGDASLRGAIDLAKARTVGDHYEVKLSGGRRAVLTLDPKVQAAAEKVLAQAKAPYGAVIVMAVDGRILAFAGRANAENRERDYELPVKVWAPAASIFKIVTASALVEAGVRPNQKVCFRGGVRSVESYHLSDDPKRDTRCEDFTFGLSRSQNGVIAKLVHKHVTPKRLRKAAAAFGFNTAANFALKTEPNRTEIPAEPLEFARVAAGFWHTELSPLGAAVATNVLASGGLSVTPRIVRHVVYPDGTEVPVVAVAPDRAIKQKVAATVADMLVSTTKYGTARTAFTDKRGRSFLGDIEVAGKTGSLSRKEPSYLAYSWFVGFAPADAPQVVVSVLLGNSELWHLKAHTAARLVLQSVF